MPVVRTVHAAVGPSACMPPTPQVDLAIGMHVGGDVEFARATTEGGENERSGEVMPFLDKLGTGGSNEEGVFLFTLRLDLAIGTD